MVMMPSASSRRRGRRDRHLQVLSPVLVLSAVTAGLVCCVCSATAADSSGVDRPSTLASWFSPTPSTVAASSSSSPPPSSRRVLSVLSPSGSSSSSSKKAGSGGLAVRPEKAGGGMWERLDRVCDHALLSQVRLKWHQVFSVLGERLHAVADPVHRARRAIKAKLDRLVAFCLDLPTPSFKPPRVPTMLLFGDDDSEEGGKERGVGAVMMGSRHHSRWVVPGFYAFRQVDAGALLMETARKLVTSLASAAKTLSQRLASHLCRMWEETGAQLGRALSSHWRRLGALTKWVKLVEVLLQRVGAEWATIVSNGKEGGDREGGSTISTTADQVNGTGWGQQQQSSMYATEDEEVSTTTTTTTIDWPIAASADELLSAAAAAAAAASGARVGGNSMPQQQPGALKRWFQRSDSGQASSQNDDEGEEKDGSMMMAAATGAGDVRGGDGATTTTTATNNRVPTSVYSPLRGSVVTVNVRYRFQVNSSSSATTTTQQQQQPLPVNSSSSSSSTGADAASNSSRKKEQQQRGGGGGGLAGWLLRSKGGGGGGEQARQQRKGAGAATPTSSPSVKTPELKDYKDKKLKEIVGGFKNLDHETLLHTFKLLGRLAGQFPDAEDVEVTIHSTTADAKQGKKTSSSSPLGLLWWGFALGMAITFALLLLTKVDKGLTMIETVWWPLLETLCSTALLLLHKHPPSDLFKSASAWAHSTLTTLSSWWSSTAMPKVMVAGEYVREGSHVVKAALCDVAIKAVQGVVQVTARVAAAIAEKQRERRAQQQKKEEGEEAVVRRPSEGGKRKEEDKAEKGEEVQQQREEEQDTAMPATTSAPSSSAASMAASGWFGKGAVRVETAASSSRRKAGRWQLISAPRADDNNHEEGGDDDDEDADDVAVAGGGASQQQQQAEDPSLTAFVMVEGGDRLRQ